jgi:hypothetical protein
MNGFAAPAKDRNPVKAGRLIAICLSLFSLVGIISTPAVAAEEERQISVYVYQSSNDSQCSGSEYPADWGPDSVLMYDGVGTTSIELYLDTSSLVQVGLNLNWLDGQDADCNFVEPSGDVYTEVTMANPLVAVTETCALDADPMCAAATTETVYASLDFFDVTEDAVEATGSFVVTWVP